MSYKKMIISGDLYEIHETEKKPQISHFRPSTVSKGCNLFSSVRRSDNISATKRQLMRRVRTQLQKQGAPLFISLTFEQDSQGLYPKQLGGGEFHDFILRMRKIFPQLSYVAVPEFQDKNKRGALHFHCLMWGVPLSLGDIRFKDTLLSQGLERTFRIIGGIWSRGFVDVIRTDGSPKLSHYLSKYFTKAWLDYRFYGFRVIYYSQNFPHPLIVDDYGDDSILKLPPEELLNILQLEEVDQKIYNNRFYGQIKHTSYQKTTQIYAK